MEKGPKKIYYMAMTSSPPDVTVRKEKSPCHHVDEVADAIVVALIFNETTIEKMIPPYPLAVAGEEINLQYQETWDEEILTLRI
jgi:hypothetical protein